MKESLERSAENNLTIWCRRPAGFQSERPGEEVARRHRCHLDVASGTVWVARRPPRSSATLPSVINSVGWYRSGDIDDVPAEWRAATVDGLLDVEVLLEAGPEPTLTATAGGRDVVYLPGPDEGDPC